MNFLYPQFLFGLFALGIPIIIHLFNFRRTKRVYFSNNLFLKNVKKTTTSKLKIKHLLILLARLLFVFFLVITFAQPYIPGKENEGGPGTDDDNLVYIYLDNSLSMSSALGSNIRGIDQGVNYIEEIISLYPRNTVYKLLTNEFGSFSRVPQSGSELDELMAEVELTGVARSMEEVISKIKSDVQAGSLSMAEAENSDVYLISDFQKSTTGDLQDIKADTSRQIYLVPVRSSYESNIFVDSVYLANPFMLAEEANELAVVLRNESEKEASDLIVRLLINGQQVANASLDMDPYADGTLKFMLNFPLEKSNRCQIVFEDYPVTFDNDFYFTLNMGNRISVLEITPGSAFLRNSAIAKVYANNQVFDFQSYSIENLDYSLIENTDLLVLNELDNTDNDANLAVVPYIQEFLAGGGHVLYIPPASGNMVFLQEVAGNPNLAASRINEPDSVAPAKVPLANPDLANPFFANMFEGESGNFEMPVAARFPDQNLRGEALLRYKTGEPYLLSLSKAYIRTETAASDPVFVFGTPLRSEFTGLYRHAIFVPVMYRLASMSKSLNNRLYYYADVSTITLETVNFAGSREEEGSAVKNDAGQRYLYKLRREEQEVIPLQRVAAGRLLMEVPQDVVQPGFYDLMRTEESAAGSNGEHKLPLLSLAFNVEKQESLIEQYSVEELQKTFDNSANIKIYEAEDVDAFSELVRKQRTSISFWKHTLLLALFFLLTEILLIRFL